MGEIVTAADIARELEVGRRTVYGWLERFDDFPPPVGRVAGAAVYDLDRVRAWHESVDLAAGRASGRYGQGR